MGFIGVTLEFQSFNISHNCVLLLFWIFLHDVGAEVEDKEAEEAAKEDEQGTSRNLKNGFVLAVIISGIVVSSIHRISMKFK